MPPFITIFSFHFSRQPPSIPLPLVATPLSRRRLNLGVAEALLLDESWPRGSINCFLVSCNTNGVSEAEFVEAV